MLVDRHVGLHDLAEDDGGVAAAGEGEGHFEIGAAVVGAGGEGVILGEEAAESPAGRRGCRTRRRRSRARV